MDKTPEKKEDNGSKDKGKLPYSLQIPTDKPSSLIEFPRYPSSESESNSSGEGAERDREEPEVKIHELNGWNDCIADKIEDLVLYNLLTIFRAAMEQIIEAGYSNDVALEALSRKGLYMAEEDPVSNIVQETLNSLSEEKAPSSKDTVFGSFQQFLKYTLVEMVSILREIRPTLTTGEAMWLLLISDFNMSEALKLETELRNLGSSASSYPQSKSNDKASDADAFPFYKGLSSSHQNCTSEVPQFGSFINLLQSQSSLVSQGEKVELNISSSNSMWGFTEVEFSDTEGKARTSAKRSNKKKQAVPVQQKFLQMHSPFKTFGKGRKVANIGKLKSSSETLKGCSSNTMSTNFLLPDGTSQVSTSSSSFALPAGDSSGTFPTKDDKSRYALVDTKISSTDENFNPLPKPSFSETITISDYCTLAGFSYDETSGKYLVRDGKDEKILQLILRVKKLQGQLQSWTDWANQRVMQVTQRLMKDQAERKILRKEKEERELLETENKQMIENITKRLQEVESYFLNAIKQVDKADSKAEMLERENSKLKKGLNTSKILESESVARIQEALEREQMTLKKAQSLENETALLHEEHEREKQKLANLQLQLDKKKRLHDNVKVSLEQERAAKEKILEQAALIRKEREDIEASLKAEEDVIRKKSAADLENYVEQIGKLENELFQLRLKSNSGRIASLRRNLNDSSSRSSSLSLKGSLIYGMFQMTESGESSESLKRERECAMCLSKENSVIFLPCAHQVLCVECNALHEKQGLKECPTCRAPIQRRIHPKFYSH